MHLLQTVFKSDLPKLKYYLLPSNPLYVRAKSLQSCLTLCDPIDGSPTGSPIPGRRKDCHPHCSRDSVRCSFHICMSPPPSKATCLHTILLDLKKSDPQPGFWLMECRPKGCPTWVGLPFNFPHSPSSDSNIRKTDSVSVSSH